MYNVQFSVNSEQLTVNNGADTTIAKFRQAGAGPFYLALLLFIWLVVGGYLLTRYVVPLLS